RSCYDRACEIGRQIGETREVKRGLGYLGTLLHEQGEYQRACEHYQLALEDCRDNWLPWLLKPAMGAAFAALGDCERAAQMFEQEREPLGHSRSSEYTKLFRAHLDLALAREDEAAGAFASAANRRRRAEACLEAVDPHLPNEDVRLARRILERAMQTGQA